MPSIQITFIEGPDAEQKRRLIADATRVVVEDLGVPQQAVSVVLHEVPAAAWGHAGAPLSETLAR